MVVSFGSRARWALLGMGGLTANEWKAAFIFTLTVFLWVADRWHAAMWGYTISTALAAIIAASALGLEVTVLPALAERCWGVLEGKPRERRVPGVTPPGAETPEQFEERVLAAFAAIPAYGLPLVVAHSGVFRVLCRALGRVAPA